MTVNGDAPNVVLCDFSVHRPRYRIEQARALAWMAQVHARSEATSRGWNAPEAEAFADRLRRVIDRCACGPSKISARGHVVPDATGEAGTESLVYDVAVHPRGAHAGERTRIYDEIVSRYFEESYGSNVEAPGDIIHVTCTGYIAPSGAQKLVASRGWGEQTRVTHAYHMGCYAALPAIRIAAGCLRTAPSSRPRGAPRVDIVHSELCSLHLDPSNHAVEQLVVESLFADGFIRYSAAACAPRGLLVLAQHEMLVPNSASAMSWATSDAGMHMTLARDVPELIAGSLRDFVIELYERAGVPWQRELPQTVFAVHPGGPRIIDGVRQLLELTDAQVQTSRAVLFEFGNMSSATLPHVWARIVDDDAISVGTLVVSLAFGPGLTICGGLFRKV